MNPQLQAVTDELNAAETRLHELAATTAPLSWSRRPEPARWSVAECVAHLNLTSAASLPRLREALAGAVPDSRGPMRYRRDPMGWLLWRTMGPPVRMRLKTTAPFIPRAAGDPDELVAEFDRWQAELVGCVREADGLPLGRIWIRSPFNHRVRYNLYSAFTILSRHQHRHLWQAERAAAAL